MKNNGMSIDTIKVLWLQRRKVIDSELANAAFKLADTLAAAPLEGVSETLGVVEFQCAIHKRNMMLAAIASELMGTVDYSVTETETYEQYKDGIISSTECCDLLIER